MALSCAYTVLRSGPTPNFSLSGLHPKISNPELATLPQGVAVTVSDVRTSVCVAKTRTHGYGLPA